MAPKTQKQWTVQGKGNFDNLKWNESAPVPEIGDTDVLVKCKMTALLQNTKSHA